MKTEKPKTNKKRFIAWSPAKERFNYKNESMGMSGERAIYRPKGNSDISNDRRYRGDYPVESAKDLTIMTYRSQEAAQQECDWINKMHKDSFEVKQIL